MLQNQRSDIRNILLILLIIPFWTSFLLRVYAWKVILTGIMVLLNVILNKLRHLSDEPLSSMLYNHYAVILGVVYTLIYLS